MILFQASIVLSLALCGLCLPRDRRPAIADSKVELNSGGPHGDMSHIGRREPEHHEAYVSHQQT